VRDARAVLDRQDPRRAGLAVDEGQLAEEVPGAEGGLERAQLDHDRAGEDDEQRRAGVALERDDLAGLVLLGRGEPTDEIVVLEFVQPLEKPDPQHGSLLGYEVH